MKETRTLGSFPLRIKVSALVVLALAGLAIATGLSNYFYFRSVLKHEAIGRGKAISGTLASALVEMPDSAIGSTIASVKKEANLAYVEVVGPNGNIIAHTFEGRAPAQEASVLKEGERVQETTIDGNPVIDVPAPVITGSIVHVGLDPSAATTMVLEAQKLLIGITAAALFVFTLLTVLIVSRFVEPMRKLTLVARRIVQGDLSQKVEVTTTDEVGELAAAFADGREIERGPPRAV